MIRKVLSIRGTLVLLIVMIGTGLFIDINIQLQKSKSFDFRDFEQVLARQMKEADRFFENLYTDNTIDFHKKNELFQFLPENIAAFCYEKDKLIYWSTNEFVFQFPSIDNPSGWNYEHAANVHALFKWQVIDESVAVLVLIPLKSAFPYVNQYLRNEFFPPFQVHTSINITHEEEPDPSSAIYDTKGNYLFSLNSDSYQYTPVLLKWLAFTAYSLAFIFFLILYLRLTLRKTKHTTRNYLLVSSLFVLILLISNWLNIPFNFYQNPLFSPQHYAVNRLIASFTHLSIFVLFGAVVLYSYAVLFRGKSIRILSVALIIIYIAILVLFLRSLINHSGIVINFYLLDEITFASFWAHILLFFMLAGGFFLLITAFPSLYSQRLKVAGVYIILATLSSLGALHHLNQEKQIIKYKILTENILLNGSSMQDPIADLLLEELAFNLHTDPRIKAIVTSNDSAHQLFQHLETTHSQLFNHKFDISLTFVPIDDPEVLHYLQMLQQTATPVGSTGFYHLPSNLFDHSYAGLIAFENLPELYPYALLFEFQNKRNFRSYSLPDLLMSDNRALLQQPSTSVAVYENDQLIYNDLLFEWPEVATQFKNPTNGFFKLKQDNGVFYTLQNKFKIICVTELKTARVIDKLFYFILIIVMNLLAGRVLIVLHSLIHHRSYVSLGLTGKFQLVFIVLLMISFIGILLFSVNYFRRNYESEQLKSSEEKKHYIQSSLQEVFYWVNDINAVNEQSINSILQEIAYRYQTDIHIYNQHGELAGSSQNLIFTKQLSSRIIHPAVIFSEKTPAFQYEKIGQLNYLSGYSDLFNGDYLPIGYISIPQYLSQTEINQKINQFLIALIQIFAIIIILSIVLVLLAGNQMAIPLRLVEEKLKTMKINGSNARIEYKGHDEVGQLVEQYNKTVDELERSTELLLQSERETAWRTMARQVAHEINNPLTPMKLTIQHLQRIHGHSTEKFDEYFKIATNTLIEQIDNLSRIAGTFSQFARLPETELKPLDCAARLHSAVELFRNNSHGIELIYEGKTSGINVMGDPEQLTRMFNNILRNAVQSIPSERKGIIHVRIFVVEQQVAIHINDNGIGISEHDKPNIFKPNFTTKSSGMGLGLSISKAIAENTGGSIRFETEHEKGTTFFIYLPILL